MGQHWLKQWFGARTNVVLLSVSFCRNFIGNVQAIWPFLFTPLAIIEESAPSGQTFFISNREWSFATIHYCWYLLVVGASTAIHSVSIATLAFTISVVLGKRISKITYSYINVIFIYVFFIWNTWHTYCLVAEYFGVIDEFIQITSNPISMIFYHALWFRYSAHSI